MNLASHLVLVVSCGLLGAGCASVSEGSSDTANEPEGDLGVVRSALLTVSTEAEAATGAGTVENDSAASGGQLRAFTVVGSEASASFVTTGAMQSVAITARATCSPQITIFIDNVSVGTKTVTSSAWGTYTFPTSAYAPGTHTIRYRYRTGPAGCVLRVDRAVITTADPPPPPPPPATPTVLEAEAATGAGTVLNDPTASGGQYRSMSASFQSATIPFTTTAPTVNVTLRVRRTGSCGPNLAVAQIGFETGAYNVAYVTSSTWTNLIVPVTVGPGSHVATLTARSVPSPCVLDFDVATLNPN